MLERGRKYECSQHIMRHEYLQDGPEVGKVEDFIVTLANRANREHEEDREGDVAHDTDTNVCLPEFLELHERHLKKTVSQ